MTNAQNLYTGEYSRINFNGLGRIIKENNEILEGHFRDGELHGWGRHIDKEGSADVGWFNMGQRTKWHTFTSWKEVVKKGIFYKGVIIDS